MAFTRNLNPNSFEALKELRESLWEFTAKTWNDVYQKYNTKLRIKDDILAFPGFDRREMTKYNHQSKVAGRRDEPIHRDSKVRCNPYSRPIHLDSDRRPRPVREDRNSGWRNDIAPHQAGKELKNIKINDYHLRLMLHGYNFNVSIIELVEVLKDMGDKVRCPKETKNDTSKWS